MDMRKEMDRREDRDKNSDSGKHPELIFEIKYLLYC